MPHPDVSREAIRKAVREFVLSEDLAGEDPASLADDTPLITGGIVDSIASVRLVSYFEEHFGVTFDSRDVTVENLDTVLRMVNIVERKIRGKEGAGSGNPV